jgi:upstream activation factor subunit UAF30
VKKARPAAKKKKGGGGGGGGGGSALQKPKELSEELEAICGVSSCTRSDVIKRVWEYIRGNDLKVEGGIKCDAAMKKVFGKSKISNTDIMGGISPHLS